MQKEWRKILSGLIAAVLVFTTCSAGFSAFAQEDAVEKGNTPYAAEGPQTRAAVTSAPTEADYQALANAMKNDAVKNVTFEQTKDSTISKEWHATDNANCDLTKAFTLFSNIVIALAKNTETAKVNNSIESTYVTIKEALQNVMTPADFAGYNVAAALKSFFGADSPELAEKKTCSYYIVIDAAEGYTALLNEETLPATFATYVKLTIGQKGVQGEDGVETLFNYAPSVYSSTVKPAAEFKAVTDFFTTSFLSADIPAMLDIELRQVNDTGAKALDKMDQYAPEVLRKFMSDTEYKNYQTAPAFIADARTEAAKRYIQKIDAFDKKYGETIPTDDVEFVVNEKAAMKSVNDNLYNWLSKEGKQEEDVKAAYAQYSALNKQFESAIARAYCSFVNSVCDAYQTGDTFAFTPDNIGNAQDSLSRMQSIYKSDVPYSQKKAQDVKDAQTRQNAFETAINVYTSGTLANENFTNAAKELPTYMNGSTPKPITAENAAQTGAFLDKIEGYYGALSDEKKQETQIAAYKSQIDALRAAYTTYVNETTSSAFLAAAKELLPQFFDGATLKPVTMENYFTVNAAASKLESLYDKLTEEQKKDATIKSYGDQVAALRAALNAIVPEEIYKTAPVTYPDGMKAEDVTNLLAKLDAFLTGDAFAELTGLSLSTLISDNLYNDAMMSTIVKTVMPALVSALGDSAGMASLVGIYVFPDDVAKSLPNEFASVKHAIYLANNDWSQVDWSTVSWNGISNRAEFIHALSCALSGIRPLLETLLTNGNALSLAGIKGNEGYEKVVLPLLEQLGCKNVASTAEFKSDPTMEGYLSKILNPLLARVEEILASPTTELTRLLPTLGYMANFDMIAGGVAEITKPLASMLNVSELLAGLGVNLSDLVGTINALLKDTGIVLPDINWANLAGRGTLSKVDSVRESGTRVCITANTADTGMALMQYLVETLKTNSNALFGALGLTEGPVYDAVNALLLADTNQIIGALYQALTAGPIPDVNWDMSQFQWTKNNLSYPEGLTPERLDKFAASLDAMLNTMLPGIAGQSLPALIRGALYQDAIVSSLAQALYGLLGNDSLAPVLAQLGIDVSIDHVAAGWAQAYPEAAAALEGKTAWSEVDFTNVSWNVTGRESFANALAAALRPLNSVLGVLLCGDSLNILDLVTINGANGYQNAVLPLLRAFGCENALDAAAFQAAVEENPDAILTNILNPVLALVDKIAADPVTTLIDLLPNLAYFLDNGGLTKALHALVLPVTNVTDPILPLMTEQDLFGFIFDLTGLSLPLDLNDVEGTLISALNSVLETAGLALTLPAIDWSVLAGCGTLVDEDGNPANPSARAEATYRVQASRADATLTVLRYVVDVLQADGNAAVLKNLILGLGEQGNLIWMIVEPLLTEEPDTVITTLVNLLVPAEDDPTPNPGDDPTDNPQEDPKDNPGGQPDDKPGNSDTGDAMFGAAGFLMLTAGAVLVVSRKKRR